MDYFADFGYLGLFIAAFLAATILPLSSELVLSALLLTGASPNTLILVATVANVFGSLVNDTLGYWASLGVIKRWLNLSEQEFNVAEQRFKKYGLWSLLLAWVPIIGDPLTVVAGLLRIRLLWFLILVSIGKLLRYIVIAYVVLQAN
jgi:membrane protein YqaA with SNARE-associated domain